LDLIIEIGISRPNDFDQLFTLSYAWQMITQLTSHGFHGQGTQTWALICSTYYFPLSIAIHVGEIPMRYSRMCLMNPNAGSTIAPEIAIRVQVQSTRIEILNIEFTSYCCLSIYLKSA